jgi:lipid A 3-O-deacylase
MLAMLPALCVGVAHADSVQPNPISTMDLTMLAAAEFRLETSDASPKYQLGLMQEEPGPSTLPESPPEIAPFGTAESSRWNLLGGVGHNLDDDSEAFLGVGFSYFVATRLSLEVEFNGWYFNVEEGSAWGINSNLLIRWHFWQSNDGRWTLFGDAGAGLLLSTENVPSTGSDFNFTPQLGGGFSLDIGNDNRLLAGARWHHVSNANTRGDNPGQDNLLFFAGVSFPF